MALNVLRNVLEVRRGETVTIETWTHNLRDAGEFVLQARRLGAYPLLLYEDEDRFWEAVDSCSSRILGGFPRHETALLQNTDAYVFLYGPAAESRRQNLDSPAISRLEAYNPRWYATARASGVRYARLELGRVSEDRSSFFGADATDWRKELLEASAVAPRELTRVARRFQTPLEQGRELRIQHPNGTDLRLRLRQRAAQVDTGQTAVRGGDWVRVIPAGSLTVAVDESFAEGTVVSNAPIHPKPGTPTGGTWTFFRGRLTDFSYKSHERDFARALVKAGAGARSPGLLGLGLNPYIDSAPRCEDERLGNVLVSIGGNRTAGGRNNAPWMDYLLVRDATVSIDGKAVLADGKVVA